MPALLQHRNWIAISCYIQLLGELPAQAEICMEKLASLSTARCPTTGSFAEDHMICHKIIWSYDSEDHTKVTHHGTDNDACTNAVREQTVCMLDTEN